MKDRLSAGGCYADRDHRRRRHRRDLRRRAGAVGVEVAFVARGAHLAAMRANGLRIEGDRGETLIRPAQATDDIASIGAGRLRAALRQIVGCRDRRRAASPDCRAGYRGRAVAERGRCARAADPDPRARGGDGRHRLCDRLDRRARRGAPDRHLLPDDLRRAGRRAPARAASGCAICAPRPASTACSAPTSWCRYGRNSSCWCRSPTSTR